VDRPCVEDQHPPTMREENLARAEERLKRDGPEDETSRALFLRQLDLEVECIGLEVRERALNEAIDEERGRLERVLAQGALDASRAKLDQLRHAAAELDDAIALGVASLDAVEKAAPERIR